MATKIQYVTDTWNPIVGCQHISPGCDHCYAEKMAGRIINLNSLSSKYKYVVDNKVISSTEKNGTVKCKQKAQWNGSVSMEATDILKPLSWKKPRRVFVCSMGDLFYKDVPTEWIDKVMAMIALHPQHTFLVLTKRADNMHKYFNRRTSELIAGWEEQIYEMGIGIKDDPNGAASQLYNRTNSEWPLNNLWLGVTCENQDMANLRIPYLLQTPAAKRFVSYEPALGPIDFCKIIYRTNLGPVIINSLSGIQNIMYVQTSSLDWIICGAESGSGHRPMDDYWPYNVKNDCVKYKIPFFYKQKYIGNKKISLPFLDNQIWDQIPLKYFNYYN